MDITVKSTGTLFDEWITATMKERALPDNQEVKDRVHQLGNALTVRVGKKKVLDPDFRSQDVWNTVDALRIVLKECWDAQEVISKEMQEKYTVDVNKLARAAMTAQSTNKIRNDYIRQIDRFMGESEITQLEKTYVSEE